jgi:hypothetical protein
MIRSITEQVDVAVRVSTCIRKLTYSNIGENNEGILVIFLVSSEELWNIFSNFQG